MDAFSVREAFTEDLVLLGVDPPRDKDELFRAMAQSLARAGRVADVDDFITALEEREELGPTFMGAGLALPHGRSTTVNRSSVVFWRLREPMRYVSCGESGDVSRVFMLAVPAGGDSEHLRALALLARLLMDDDSVERLDEARTAEEAVDVVLEFAKTHS